MAIGMALALDPNAAHDASFSRRCHAGSCVLSDGAIRTLANAKTKDGALIRLIFEQPSYKAHNGGDDAVPAKTNENNGESADREFSLRIAPEKRHAKKKHHYERDKRTASEQQTGTKSVAAGARRAAVAQSSHMKVILPLIGGIVHFNRVSGDIGAAVLTFDSLALDRDQLLNYLMRERSPCEPWSDGNAGGNVSRSSAIRLESCIDGLAPESHRPWHRPESPPAWIEPGTRHMENPPNG
jgi:hypothetical protein